MDLISVIVPVYNSERYLEACLDGIVHQTYRNLEILLVDDGSTDRSGKICDRYAAMDERIRVIHQKNAGMSAARNTGLAMAGGRWISFLDSDDIPEEDLYSFLMELACTHRAQISHCGYKRMREDGELLKEVAGSGIVLEQNPAEAAECMLTGCYFTGGLWNKLFLRDCLEGLRFSEELRYNEDILFNCLAFQNAETIVFADETKYRYYEHPTSACHAAADDRKWKDSVSAARMFLSSCRSNEMEDVAKRRLFRVECGQFRYLILSGAAGSAETRALGRQLIRTSRSLPGLTGREKGNLHFMAAMPAIYRAVYRIYDKLRTPNMDAKRNMECIGSAREI